MSDLGDSSEKRVLVIGAAGLDVITCLEGTLRKGISNPSQMRTSFGGVARNVAENLARLGQPVSLLTAIGKDRLGQDVLTHAIQAGVDTAAVYQTDRFPTGFYMAVADGKGKRLFAFDDMRAVEEINESYLSYHEDLFQASGLVFLDANLPETALQMAFQLAQKYHLPVCADPTSSVLAPRLKPFLDQITLVVPNQAEASLLAEREFDPSSPEQALETARALVSRGAEIVFISLAEYGVCYATSTTHGHIPAIRTRVTDLTGAGDALTAAVIFSLLNDIDIDDAARLGVAAASLTLRHPGSVVSDLSLEKLYDHLSD